MRTEHMQKDNIEPIGTKRNLASLVAAGRRYEEAQVLYREAENNANESNEVPPPNVGHCCKLSFWKTPELAANQGEVQSSYSGS